MRLYVEQMHAYAPSSHTGEVGTRDSRRGFEDVRQVIANQTRTRWLAQESAPRPMQMETLCTWGTIRLPQRHYIDRCPT